MSEFVVVASVKAKPGMEDAVREALSSVVGPTREEEGNLAYALHQGKDDATRFAVVERWASAEALEAHFQTPYMVQLLGAAGELLSEPPDIVRYDAVA